MDEPLQERLPVASTDQTSVTDPTGVAFISYRRTRSDEIESLVRVLHDHGIPTWRDTDNLRNEQTEVELKRILRDPQTANAVLWVTPDVRDSRVIGRIEIPGIHRRHQANDSFFVVPVAANGIDYAGAEEIASQYLGLRDFKGWNFERIDSSIAANGDAVRITKVVLGRRLEAIRQALSASDPIRLGIFTRGRPPQDSELHLAFDWQPRFDGRQATAAMWERTLLPSLRTVVEAVSRHHPGRAVVARGQACLPALFALGAAFLEPRQVHLIWQQHMRDSGRVQDWSLRSCPEESGLNVEVVPKDVAAEDIAVCVTFRNTVHQAVKRGQASNDIPRFRAVVDASLPEGHSTVIDSPGRARDAVSKVAEGIHAAQAEYPAGGKLHIFMDAPAGFAVMLGQKLNGMGPVQTYEHEQLDGIGRYAPAALLHPGA